MDIREVLHWLVDQNTVSASARAGQPTADEVRQAIDANYGYTPAAETPAE